MQLLAFWLLAVDALMSVLIRVGVSGIQSALVSVAVVIPGEPLARKGRPIVQR